MNLFAARLTGKMLSTETFEKTVYDMQERVKRYRQIEKSPELAEYKELKQRVESSEFKARKNELVSRKYKDTDEGRLMASYERLKKSRNISEAGQEQLLKIEAEINTEDFRRRNALWADTKRWEHSEEYKIEQRFKELGKLDDIKFYFKQREEKIDWAELFRPAFDDDMSSSKNWKPGFGYANPAMKDGHSRTSELQAYNAGMNTFFAEGRMDIETRAGSVKAVAWDEKKGFTEAVFDYTSDVMNTKEAFAQESGLFMAKVRTQGIGHHFFGLTTGKQGSPMIALYHYNGNRHQVGYVNGRETRMVDLTGVLRSLYHVYSFRWTKNELIWYVNNLELLRMPNYLPKEAMFFIAQSWLPKSEKGGEGKLKVQWARVYRSVDDSPLAQRNAALRS